MGHPPGDWAPRRGGDNDPYAYVRSRKDKALARPIYLSPTVTTLDSAHSKFERRKPSRAVPLVVRNPQTPVPAAKQMRSLFRAVGQPATRGEHMRSFHRSN